MYSGHFYISAHRLVVKNDQLTTFFRTQLRLFFGLILYLRVLWFWLLNKEKKNNTAKNRFDNGHERRYDHKMCTHYKLLDCLSFECSNECLEQIIQTNGVLNNLYELYLIQLIFRSNQI